MVKPSLRTKSVGTKVTDEEYAELERAAQTGGKTLGEWCRETLLARVNGQEPLIAPAPARHTDRSPCTKIAGEIPTPACCTA